MKITRSQLRRIIQEHCADLSQHSIQRQVLPAYLGMLRAMHIWFHGAHNLTKGTGFAGDHVNLYGKIYSEIQEEMDAAIEKAIGVTGDEEMGCPIMITTAALEILNVYPSPAYMSAEDIAHTAKTVIGDYLNLVTEVFYTLEQADELPLGLNDFLMASANQHEEYAYLLLQRTK